MQPPVFLLLNEETDVTCHVQANQSEIRGSELHR
jgi:hypothetical protein